MAPLVLTGTVRSWSRQMTGPESPFIEDRESMQKFLEKVKQKRLRKQGANAKGSQYKAAKEREAAKKNKKK